MCIEIVDIFGHGWHVGNMFVTPGRLKRFSVRILLWLASDLKSLFGVSFLFGVLLATVFHSYQVSQLAILCPVSSCDLHPNGFATARSVLYLSAGLLIRITLMFIWIHLFTVLRIRIRIRRFAVMRIRIRILIIGMQICEHWSNDFPGLRVEPLWCASTALHGSIWDSIRIPGYGTWHTWSRPCYLSPSSLGMLLAYCSTIVS